VARDQAHKRLVVLLEKGKKLPFDLRDNIIFYAGPTPARPGQAVGSIGPTTSYRMDPYTRPLLEQGLKGVIGKGERSPQVYRALKRHQAIYFIAVGGIAALLSKKVIKSRIIAYPELGAEAIRELAVKDFPVVVAFDQTGRSVFNK
jgi:fumarate hydratase subunit beta